MKKYTGCKAMRLFKTVITCMGYYINRHIRDRSTNQIAGNSLFSFEIIQNILDKNTQQTRPVDIMMARAKRIYILMIKVISFFDAVFPKRKRNHVVRVSMDLRKQS